MKGQIHFFSYNIINYNNMKITNKIILFSTLLFTLISCEREIIENNTNQLSKGVEIKNGRLYFQSKEAFTNVYKQYADASDAEISKYFMPLYKQGFYSLRPVATEENEQELYNHYIKLINLNQARTSNRTEEDIFDYLDDLEDIIGDDAFAAFLNNEAEIQIADDIYKYTDVGLFITKEDKYNILTEYLDSKSISKDLTIETSESARSSFFSLVPCQGNQPISYVIAAPDEPEVSYFNSGYWCYTTGGSSGSNTPVSGSPASTDESFLAYINNLSACTPHSGLFGNLFGDNNVCIDRYEDRRRVKTKAFNYNYFLVFHLGVKCVHQYKGWTGFWRVEATDEIRLFVEAAQFEYDLDELVGNTAINNQTRERTYFMNNQKIHYMPNSITIPNWGTPSITYQNMTSLPPIFQDDLSFEFFGTGWDWLDSQIQNGIDSNLKASKLNEYFYDALYSTATTQLQNALGTNVTPPANRTFVAKFPEQGKLIFQKSVLNNGFNIGVRQRTFDWGAEFSFSTTANADGSWSMSGGAGNVIVRPTNFKVKIIGAARRGSGWHGSKFNVGFE